jgi:hypothetical protein
MGIENQIDRNIILKPYKEGEGFMKTAKGILMVFLAAVFCVGFAGVGIAAGGNGNGQDGTCQRNGGDLKQGNGTGECILSQLVSEEPLEQIVGIVAEVGVYGQGISVDTGDDVVQVYSIGPVRYWNDVLEVARPDVGDDIAVSGREVVFSDGTTRFVAFMVEIGGEEIMLRDENTGLPVWRADGYSRRHRR